MDRDAPVRELDVRLETDGTLCFLIWSLPQTTI